MDRITLARQRCVDDTGASTAMMLTIFASLMVLLVATLTLIQVQIAASRAAVAADLAALSAADAARGLMVGEPCELAQSTVASHGATMESCDIRAPGIAHIQVSVASPIGLNATAESRAGPKQP
ncbi:MAG TPA: hypothetical protein K8V32_02210 [Enteractinococcus helveticum]|uniref:Uncharacterized protein n=1 Tax=Enteractinococcus helveticum TaxID=1837282 RepID=A0A921FMT8_9MICC|nr:Rv3654c family TadE-like protein [Enteractinococcus helveticum]HJF13601.1 hypothetical protein [Enteractinococcus helveticum]